MNNSTTTTQAAQKLQKEFDDAFHIINGHFGIMRKFGDNIAPPEGELDAETVVDIGVSGSQAALRLTNAFYGLLNLEKDLKIKRGQS